MIPDFPAGSVVRWLFGSASHVMTPFLLRMYLYSMFVSAGSSRVTVQTKSDDDYTR